MVDAKTNNSQKKIYVLDTSVLLSSPYAIFAFDEHVVWIPYNVITDLDAMRKTTNEASKNAQEALRIIEELRERVIAPDVLCNAMDNLDDSLRLCLRRPDAAMQLPSPRRVQKKFFHT